MEDPKGTAVSFYFQPRTPQNKSHREEAILVKDLVRDALREAERRGGNGAVRADLQRILEMAEQLHGNHARAKAVFACHEQGIWREFDLPSQIARTQLIVNQRFHLKPLAEIAASHPRCCVVLADRERARFFVMRAGQIGEAGELAAAIPRRPRTDGFAGYEAGHIERHIDNEVMRHFKGLADRLQEMHAAQGCELFAVGCRSETWPEIEPHLHAYVKQRLIGRLTADPATASLEQVRDQAQRLLDAHARSERHGLLREVLGESQRNGRGAVGLRHVLTSLERGEVQALLFGEGFSAPVAECCNCGHLDTRMVKACAACGRETRHVDDVSEVLITRALGEGIRLVYVADEPEFTRAGGVGALLRFRADQNTPQKLAV